MSQYTSVSIKEVVARVLRNVKLADATYSRDILEWIGEGVERLTIKNRLNKTNQEVKIKNYAGKLPCGLKSIDAVIYEGGLLRYGFSKLDNRILKGTTTVDVGSYFRTDNEFVNQQDYKRISGLELKQVDTSSVRGTYYIELDYIKPSFKEGCLVICYKEMPIDDEGYPLIPDIYDAKEALFWYVTSRLVFSGYKLPDARMDFDYCNNQAVIHFRRAKNEIKRLGIEEKESQKNMWVRLVPPNDYYETFFSNAQLPEGNQL